MRRKINIYVFLIYLNDIKRSVEIFFYRFDTHFIAFILNTILRSFRCCIKSFNFAIIVSVYSPFIVIASSTMIYFTSSIVLSFSNCRTTQPSVTSVFDRLIGKIRFASVTMMSVHHALMRDFKVSNEE